MVVFLSMSLVAIPPRVSIPRVSGVTSSKTTSFASPVKTAPWIAAPSATHSSGLMFLSGSLPKIFLTSSTTIGTRVEPPTSKTWSMSDADMFASFKTWRTGSTVFCTRSSINCSNFARVKSMSKCFGPSAPAVMYGRLMFAFWREESSIFAFSAASFKRCIATGSFFKSIPSFFLNSSAR